MAGKVMFTAVVDNDGNVGPVAADTTVIFNTIVTNIGGSYDNTSGKFTAPQAGYYFFTFSYQAPKNRNSGLSLMKNADVIVRGVHHTNEGQYLTDIGGNSAVLYLTAGDKVFVQLPVNHHVLGSDRTTSFTGFQIS